MLNTVLKPFLRLVTLPLAILTFGLAWFFVSLLMLGLTTDIVSGFHIHGFWHYVEATLIVWAVNVVLDLTPGPWQLTGSRRRIRPRPRRARLTAGRSRAAPRSDNPIRGLRRGPRQPDQGADNR